MSKNLQDQIEEVMDWFDFDAVHKYMVNSNWIWIDSIPEKADLRRYVREEMGKLWHKTKSEVNGSLSHESGGFLITYTWGRGQRRTI